MHGHIWAVGPMQLYSQNLHENLKFSASVLHVHTTGNLGSGWTTVNISRQKRARQLYSRQCAWLLMETCRLLFRNLMKACAQQPRQLECLRRPRGIISQAASTSHSLMHSASH